MPETETMRAFPAETTQPGLAVPAAEGDIERLVNGQHHDPHSVLGAHPLPAGAAGEEAVLVRAWRPDGAGVTLLAGEERTEMRRIHPAGVFAATVPGSLAAGYRLAVRQAGDLEVTVDDPYRFWPTIGDLDLHLHGEGRHEGLWRHLGAVSYTHLRAHETRHDLVCRLLLEKKKN